MGCQYSMSPQASVFLLFFSFREHTPGRYILLANVMPSTLIVKLEMRFLCSMFLKSPVGVNPIISQAYCDPSCALCEKCSTSPAIVFIVPIYFPIFHPCVSSINGSFSCSCNVCKALSRVTIKHFSCMEMGNFSLTISRDRMLSTLPGIARQHHNCL